MDETNSKFTYQHLHIRKIVRGLIWKEAFINVDDLLLWLHQEGHGDIAAKLQHLRSTLE